MMPSAVSVTMRRSVHVSFVGLATPAVAPPRAPAGATLVDVAASLAGTVVAAAAATVVVVTAGGVDGGAAAETAPANVPAEAAPSATDRINTRHPRDMGAEVRWSATTRSGTAARSVMSHP